MKHLTASDRNALIRLASQMPPGSPERKAVLAGVLRQAKANKSLWMSLLRHLRFPGWELKDRDFWGTPLMTTGSLNAEWEKTFDTGSRHPSSYGVHLQISLDENHTARATMGWLGPDMFGGRDRRIYDKRFSDAFTGSGRAWVASPELVRWIQATFERVKKDIQGFVEEDRQSNFAGTRQAGTIQIGDMVDYRGHKALVTDTHGYPVRTVDLRWTVSGTTGARDEVSESRRKVPVSQVQKRAKVAREVNVPGRHILDNAEVTGDAEVSENAKVSGSAHVSSGAVVRGNAVVTGRAQVYEDAVVRGNALVTDRAKVYQKALVADRAKVSGSAVIFYSGRVLWDAEVSGNATVAGLAAVYGRAKVYDNAKVYRSALVRGNAQVFGNAMVFSGAAVVEDDAQVYGNAKVTGTAWISGRARIGGRAVILGGKWDGSEGEVTSGRWKAPGVPA